MLCSGLGGQQVQRNMRCPNAIQRAVSDNLHGKATPKYKSPYYLLREIEHARGFGYLTKAYWFNHKHIYVYGL